VFEPNETRKFEVMADEKTYELEAVAAGIEKIKLSRYGRIPSLKIEPIASFGGVFVRKGRIWMWVSRESRRLCTKISAEVPVARIHLYLREVRGPGADQWPGRMDDEKQPVEPVESGEEET
ncbi:MAG: DUF3108 domain-containing protein, partial [Kiritimatiellia bacterium]|nr:DUF3108 domain-containing protein [Kiritimatiellia bacterium]